MPLTDNDCAATYKILVLGDTTVGKSSLLRCLTGKEFQDKSRPTVALDFVRRTFEVDGAIVRLNVWDTAGQQRFHSVTRKYYNGVQGVVLVYDITDRKSFNHLSHWVDTVSKGISNSKNKYDAVPMMLVGNKSDLEGERTIMEEEGKQLAAKIMAFDFIETSAKANQNVFMVFKRLAQFVTESFDPKVMKSYHPYMLRPPEIMEEKRKQQEMAKKKRKRKKKVKKSPKNKQKEEFLYIGNNPSVEFTNGLDSKVEVINSSNDTPKSKEKRGKGRGVKITRTKLHILRTKKKNERHLNKKKTVGSWWRKLFRRKRKTTHEHTEVEYRSKQLCVIS